MFHADATVDVPGVFTGPAADYPGVLFAAVAGLTRMFHPVANETIEVRGDRAVAESYAIAFTIACGPSRSTDQPVGGRYLDRFERHGGQWKFTSRRFVPDWTTSHPASDQGDAGMLAMLSHGGRHPDDPVHSHRAG